MKESDRIKRLLARIRNDLKALARSQRNRMQARLLEDAKDTLGSLEEVLRGEELKVNLQQEEK